MKRHCLICNKEFKAKKYHIVRGWGLYCSANCHHLSMRGKRYSPKTEFKVGNLGVWLGKKRPDLKQTKAAKTMFKKGLVPWNKGLKGFMAGEEHWNYSHGLTHTPEMKAFYQRNREYRKRCNGGNHTYFDWLALKYAYGNSCVLCGKIEPKVKITEDHIIPVYRGGTNNIENIQPLCFSCNSRKGAREVMST